MSCSMPGCNAEEPHRHLALQGGPPAPWELSAGQRRKRGQRAGWPEDKIMRFVEDPTAEEFTRLGPTYDDMLPMDRLWEWLADAKRGIVRPPFTIPPDYGQPAEPEGNDRACE